VYVEGRKIASVGLRIRRGASYHGMALNIDVDLEPFSRINPCGFERLEVTDLRALGIDKGRDVIQQKIQAHLLRHLRLDREKTVSGD
jgi:lipoyl(octanoyl) transferase